MNFFKQFFRSIDVDDLLKDFDVLKAKLDKAIENHLRAEEIYEQKRQDYALAAGLEANKRGRAMRVRAKLVDIFD